MPQPSPAEVARVALSVAIHFVDFVDTNRTRSDCGWQHAAFMKGVVAVSRLENVSMVQRAKLDSYVHAWGEGQRWECCNARRVLAEGDGANDMSCGSTYAEVWMAAAAKNDTYLRSCRDDVLSAVVRRTRVDDWWWVDAHFMAMGTFARFGHITGDPRYHDKALALYRDSADRRGLWSEPAGLYFRDASYFNRTSPHGASVFWGRGNGWAAGGLARALAYTPAGHPAFVVYSSRLRSLAAAAARLQSPDDGLWRASLLDPDSVPNPETTGSAGLLVGLAYGVRSGVLDRTAFLPVVVRAWHGLLRHAVSGTGALGYCQPVGAGPAPATPRDTSDFCVGLFLLAASEVALLSAVP